MGMRIVVPSIGWSNVGIIREWYKDDGDWINVGAPLGALLMGARLHAVTALDSGFLRLKTRKRLVGTTVKHGDVLGVIVAPGESYEVVSQSSPSVPLRVKL